MTPATLNLEVWIGATFGPVLITCNDSDSVAVDLTGWTAYAHVRKTKGGDLTLDLEPIITDAAEGEITITLTDEETAILTAGKYAWDLLLETDTGEILGPYLVGNFHIKQTYTEPA